MKNLFPCIFFISVFSVWTFANHGQDPEKKNTKNRDPDTAIQAVEKAVEDRKKSGDGNLLYADTFKDEGFSPNGGKRALLVGTKVENGTVYSDYVVLLHYEGLDRNKKSRTDSLCASVKLENGVVKSVKGLDPSNVRLNYTKETPINAGIGERPSDRAIETMKEALKNPPAKLPELKKQLKEVEGLSPGRAEVSLFSKSVSNADKKTNIEHYLVVIPYSNPENKDPTEKKVVAALVTFEGGSTQMKVFSSKDLEALR